MITYTRQNIFDCPARTLVNPVNTVGVMGAGLAKQFKNRYPEMFFEYRKLCEKKEIEIGKLWLFKPVSGKWILNFPTKTHFRLPSKLEYIEEGLKTFVESYENLGILSIAFPELGCGNGSLNFREQVRPIMEFYLRNLPIKIFICIRYGYEEI